MWTESTRWLKHYHGLYSLKEGGEGKGYMTGDSLETSTYILLARFRHGHSHLWRSVGNKYCFRLSMMSTPTKLRFWSLGSRGTRDPESPACGQKPLLGSAWEIGRDSKENVPLLFQGLGNDSRNEASDWRTNQQELVPTVQPIDFQKTRKQMAPLEIQKLMGLRTELGGSTQCSLSSECCIQHDGAISAKPQNITL